MSARQRRRLPSREDWIAPHIWIVPLTLAIAVIMLVLGFVEYKVVRVTGRLVTQSISMTFSTPFRGESGLLLDSRDLHLSHGGAGAPAGSVPSTGVVRLYEWSVAKNGRLTMTLTHRAKRELLVSASDGATFRFEMSQTGHVSAANNHEPDTSLLILQSSGLNPVPLWFAAHVLPASDGDEPPLLIEDAAVGGLTFGREQGDIDESPFVSAIDGGEITIVGTGETRQLDQGAPLSMPQFSGHIARLELAADGWHVTFAGTARKILLGPVGFQQDLTPSALDVWYHFQWIRLLCATLLAVLTALVSATFNWNAMHKKL